MEDIEPLDLPLWQEAIDRLRARHRSGPLRDLEAQIRLASHLARLAPPSIGSRAVRLNLREDEFERVLERGELELAVEVLMRWLSGLRPSSNYGPRSGRVHNLAQMPEGPSNPRQVSARLGQWLDNLLRLAARPLHEHHHRPGLHRSRYAPPRQPIQH